MRYLDDDWRLEHFSSLQDGVDGGGGGAVEGRQSDVVLAAVGHQLKQVVAGHDAGGNNSVKTSHFDAVIRIVGRTVNVNCQKQIEIKQKKWKKDALKG